MRFILMTLVGLTMVVSPALAQMPPTAVRAVPATMQTVEPHHRFTGSLKAVARGDVAALEDGRVLEVTVREGATVKKDDVIARIDARRLEAQKGELEAAFGTAEALIAQREAELRQANLDMDRSATLIRNNAISKQQHERSETELTIAQAKLATDRRRLDEIRRQLDLIQVRLDDTEVRAPYDGQVIMRHTEPGEWIKAGEPFVTLVSTGKVEAWLEIPERYAGIVSQYAQQVAVHIVGTDRKFVSASAKRVHEVHPRTRTFQYVLTLDAKDAILAPGMSVEAWLPTGPAKSSLTVPKDAIIRSAGMAYVFKAVENEGQTIAARTSVSVKFETGSLAVVESPQLTEGDMVVVEGNERLFPGTPIAVSKQPPMNSTTAVNLSSQSR
ncbi:efflux RND transporter periplasmic adaptor subunit [Bremerella sp. P1]|uniref:efflux RND transporter periplasmic adaptor subunit n=1 Tax=Bremerella sp. P1 TaxID=3026424 RepID=UPI0023686D66|nr:efflux RND transporter periplasmic adaptor subunit [Bremerella sp. P1]WDI40283.1 efflux RND transporter periplasmic adaptor subunit [Bremerella sp. P1]